MNIKQLVTTDDINKILKSDGVSIIFKHSTRCPLSSIAKKEFESFAETSPCYIQLYFVDIVQHRIVSNEIEHQTGIAHESPQIIVIGSGKVIWHTSHLNITKQAIEKALEKDS